VSRTANRFVLYYGGPIPPSTEDRKRIELIHGVRIVDEASARLLLVEGPETELRNGLKQMKGWILEPETFFRLP
jgi:hypothetical protein